MALKRFYAVEDRISLISFAFKMSVAFITTIEVSIINKRCFFAFQPEGEWLWLAFARSPSDRQKWEFYGSPMDYSNWHPGEPGYNHFIL